jgi:uncharacterized protein YndB with AHSA1/START domain
MTESAKTAARGGSAASETSLTVRRHIDATPDEVFDAWTDAEAMRQWMRPGDTTDVAAKLDVRVGGRYTIDMIGAQSTHKHHGEYQVVDRPHRLVFTWNADWIPGGSVVTLEFKARDGGTDLVLTHEGLPDRTSVENHTMGWGSILEKLDGVLS